MAINDGNKTNKGLSEDASNAFAKQPEAPKKVNNSVFNFTTGGLTASPIGRGVGSEYTSRFLKDLSEVYESSDPSFEVTVMAMDNQNETALAFSTILVALRVKGSPKETVVIPLVLEATGNKISPIIEKTNRGQIEIYRVPGDALDAVFDKKVNEKLVKAFPSSRIIIVDGMVIPANFDMANKELFYKVAVMAGVACGTELLVMTPGFQDFSVSNNIGRDSSLTLAVSFGNPEKTNAVGEVIRNDVAVRFISQSRTQERNTSLNSDNREVILTELSGYVDLVWNPVVNNNGFNYQQQYQYGPAATQKYSPRFIMTDLDVSFAYTPATVLLALANAFALSVDNNWGQAFRPVALMSSGKKGQKEINLKDIGALNIEANIRNETDKGNFGTPIDTTVATFDTFALSQLLSEMVRPGLMMSIDCPEAGPKSWYLSIFSYAANGSVRASARILKAAYDLTGGHIRKHFDMSDDFTSSEAIFTDLGNRIHNGYWTDVSGIRRDIREIDTVAAANMANISSNRLVISEWQDTFLRTDIDLMTRLNTRYKLIQAFTGESAVITGFSQRNTLTDRFMNALALGLTEAGMSAVVTTPLSAMDFNASRGIATFAAQAGVGSNHMFMNTGGFNRAPNQFQGSNNNFGRFGI
jgi:hypothetical protein